MFVAIMLMCWSADGMTGCQSSTSPRFFPSEIACRTALPIIRRHIAGLHMPVTPYLVRLSCHDVRKLEV